MYVYSLCQNCGKQWNEEDLKPIKDLHQRVAPGERMPSGECPECGALCQEYDTDMCKRLQKTIAEAVSLTNAMRKFWGGIKLAIREYAEAAHDLRNQAAVEWAKEVAALPNSDLRFPLI